MGQLILRQNLVPMYNCRTSGDTEAIWPSIVFEVGGIIKFATVSDAMLLILLYLTMSKILRICLIVK